MQDDRPLVGVIDYRVRPEDHPGITEAVSMPVIASGVAGCAEHAAAAFAADASAANVSSLL
ncbi:hypothetical protein [Streptomyces eurythermus]